MTVKAQKKEYFSPIQDKILERLEVSGSLTRRDLVRVLNTLHQEQRFMII